MHFVSEFGQNHRFSEHSRVDPGSSGSYPEINSGVIRSSKTTFARFSETRDFSQPGRLLALRGVFRAHGSSPLGPPGCFFTSLTWCEAPFLNLGLAETSGLGKSGDPTPCTRSPSGGSIWATFRGPHLSFDRPQPLQTRRKNEERSKLAFGTRQVSRKNENHVLRMHFVSVFWSKPKIFRTSQG